MVLVLCEERLPSSKAIVLDLEFSRNFSRLHIEFSRFVVETRVGHFEYHLLAFISSGHDGGCW